MPSRLWYWIAATIFVGGAVGAALFLIPRLAALEHRLTHIVVPGTAELTLAQRGIYTIYHERQSVVDGRFYRAESVSGLGVTLISATDGRAVKLAIPKATTSYTIGGHSGTAIFTFEIDRPGAYRLAAAYSDGSTGPRTVLTVGQAVVIDIFGAILGTMGIALGAFALAVAIAATTFLKRRRLLRAMAAGGGVAWPGEAQKPERGQKMTETSSDETKPGVGVGVGRRALATIIDSAILFAICYVLAALTGQTTPGGFDLRGWPFFLAVLIYFLYYIACEGRWAATPGKLAVGLYVIREAGGPIDWHDSTVRNLLRIVDGFLFYIVGAILVWMSPKHQRLGDRIAETLVVRRTKTMRQ